MLWHVVRERWRQPLLKRAPLTLKGGARRITLEQYHKKHTDGPYVALLRVRLAPKHFWRAEEFCPNMSFHSFVRQAERRAAEINYF